MLWTRARGEIPLAMWIAPVFLLHAVHALGWPGVAAVYVVLLIANLVSWRGLLRAPAPLYVLLNVMIALTASIPYALDHAVGSRIDGFASTLVFPMAVAVVDVLETRLTPGASWGSIAYTQHDQLPLLQLASITGTSGIAFLVAWFASTLNWAWGGGFSTYSIDGLLTYGGVLAAVLIWGAGRIARTPTDGKTIRAAVVSFPPGFFQRGEVTRFLQGKTPSEELPRIADAVARLQDWFLEQTLVQARAGAQLVIWPEVNLLVLKDDESRFIERARQRASAERIHLLMGMGVVEPGAKRPLENRAVMIDARGSVLFSYLKARLVPGWEAEAAREGRHPLPVVETEFGRVGSAICYDADDPHLIRAIGRGRADLFLVPANDWKEIKHVHHRMAILRAIENGVPMVRATSTGLSAAVDRVGRVVAVTDHFAPEARWLNASVPVGGIRTLYARIGDGFAAACMAGLAAAIVVAVMHRG